MSWKPGMYLETWSDALVRAEITCSRLDASAWSVMAIALWERMEVLLAISEGSNSPSLRRECMWKSQIFLCMKDQKTSCINIPI
jgi:hypothetical protein